MIDMINELLVQYTGGKFPRGMGNPYRSNSFREYYIANSISDIEEFIAMNDETNCYISVYSYTEYTQTNRNKMSAVIDVIPFDFDAVDLNDAFNDLKKLLTWAKRHNISPRVQFTGGRGFHCFLDIEPIELNHPQEVLRKFAFELNKAADLKSLDTCLFGDLERVIRIPNTKHKSSELFCITLNTKIIPFLKIEDIESMAKEKSTYVPVRMPVSGEIHELLKEYDVIVEQEIEDMKVKIAAEEERERNSLFPGLSSGVACMAFKEYIQNGAQEGIRDHALVGIIHKLRSDGFTKDYIWKQLVEFNKRCTPPQNESDIKSRLDTHFKKSYSLCTFFSKVSELCSICPNRKF